MKSVVSTATLVCTSMSAMAPESSRSLALSPERDVPVVA